MKNKNKKEPRGSRLFSIPIYIIWGMLALSIVVFILSLISVNFADFYNRYPGAFVRAVLAYLTNIFPFSIAEILIILSLPALIATIIYIIRKCHPTKRSTLVFSVSILSVASMFFSIFVLGFGCGYRGSTLDVKMGLIKKDVSVDELFETSLWLADEVDGVIEEIEFGEDKFSKMPYSLSRMNELLIEAYDSVCDEYDFVQRLNSKVKPVMLSKPMSYTHITGVYTYFTGEANINVNFPDYTIPFTAAHELAHQRGIAREDEANFVAFLVCMASDDPYIRYSGFLSMFEYVSPNIYRASNDKYFEVMDTLPSSAKAEIYAFSEWFEKYQDSVAGEISENVNNGYLQMQGTVGTKSYGLVVDLAVAYHNDKIKN